MSLLDPLNKVIDVTAHGVIPGAPGAVLVDNTAALNALVNNPANGLRVPSAGAFSPAAVAPQYRGTLYLPPGRYLFEADPTLVATFPVNLADQIDNSQLTPAMQAAQAYRDARPIGDSVRFPEGTTLWLAPGAVLVPGRGCIVDIASLLVCENVQCFDLSRSGLVVFGRAVPVLRPEWWGVTAGVDASASIQRAIDAAIHDRSIAYPIAVAQGSTTSGVTWVRGQRVVQRPSLEVELRGEYRVQQTIDVRADASRNGIWLQHAPPGTSPDATALPSGATVQPPDAATVIRGAWSGGRRRGAALIAGDALGQRPMLRLTRCEGITVQGITFVSSIAGYQPGIELRNSSIEEFGPRLPAAQDITVSSCRFEGAATPLVQVGARAEIVRDDPRVFRVPYALGRNDFGADFCLLSFDDCDFVVRGYGGDSSVAVDVRANQSLPIRYRRCDFSGSASTMMSLWGGTHFLAGCRFANARTPSLSALTESVVPSSGLDAPDASDLFLRAEYPMLVTSSVAEGPLASFERLPSSLPAGQVVVKTVQDLLPGLLALGCVSSSAQLLSTVAPGTMTYAQAADWPVVLVGTRHRSPQNGMVPSVRWGMMNVISSVSRGPLSDRDLNRGAPLVMIGGVYSGDVLVLRGACQSVLIGARTRGLRMERAYPDMPPLPFPATTVFGLLADQR